MTYRRDLDDVERLFDRDEAEDRRRSREAEREQNLRVAEQLNEHDRKLAEAAKATRAKMVATEVERAYRRMGVEPFVRADGVMVSLALLMNLGWTIREVDGQRTLIKPPPQPRPEPREELGR